MPQPNMNQMLKQVQKMQADMMKAQEALASETVQASAGGGMITSPAPFSTTGVWPSSRSNGTSSSASTAATKTPGPIERSPSSEAAG